MADAHNTIQVMRILTAGGPYTSEILSATSDPTTVAVFGKNSGGGDILWTDGTPRAFYITVFGRQ
jgi:hypothetical protein